MKLIVKLYSPKKQRVRYAAEMIYITPLRKFDSIAQAGIGQCLDPNDSRMLRHNEIS